MSVPVFIDGAAGTTGLLLEELLRDRHPSFEVLQLSESQRKDERSKRSILSEVDCAVLCLPDAAAADSAVLADDVEVRVLDASSAHRVSEGWAYGLPELYYGKQRLDISSARRVSNPGCYASGALLLLSPLAQRGLINDSAHVPILGVSGYSGGGRSMLQRFAGGGGGQLRYATYSHGVEHKHVREIVRHSPLSRKPQFVPSIGPFERGMAVVVLLSRDAFTAPVDSAELRRIWSDAYAGEQFVDVRAGRPPADQRLLMIDEVINTNVAHLYCFDSGDDITLICHLDNLGKGASMAAVQNLNVMFGFAEALGIDER